jgi:hypothetical protein
MRAGRPGADGAFAAHQQHLLALAQAAGAVVAVVGLQRGLAARPASRPRGQRGVVGHHLEAAHLAAEGVHVGHPGQGAQRRADHPVEQAAPLLQRQLGASMVNMNISPSGVVIGAMPPVGAGGQVALMPARRSVTCCVPSRCRCRPRSRW